MRVGIIGLGAVGGTLAFLLAMDGSYEIVGYDVNEEFGIAQIKDILHANPNFKIRFEQRYDELRKSDVIVICAGMPRRINETRDDLLYKNKEIIDEIFMKLGKYDGKVVITTNPVDVINSYIKLKYGVDSFGFGNQLDSQRLRLVTRRDENYVIGEHGMNMLIFSTNPKNDYKLITYENEYVLKNKGKTEFGPAYNLYQLINAITGKGEGIYEVSIFREELGISIGSRIYFKKGEFTIKDSFIRNPREKEWKEIVEKIRSKLRKIKEN